MAHAFVRAAAHRGMGRCGEGRAGQVQGDGGFKRVAQGRGSEGHQRLAGWSTGRPKAVGLLFRRKADCGLSQRPDARGERVLAEGRSPEESPHEHLPPRGHEEGGPRGKGDELDSFFSR